MRLQLCIPGLLALVDSCHAEDSDTIRVMGDGRDCPAKRQQFGTRARQFTGDAVFGKTVTIPVKDVDRYGRPCLMRAGPLAHTKTTLPQRGQLRQPARPGSATPLA
jgi:endonuclease YncB( thermonuclease family)